jgi:hypothetical protein
VSDGFSLRDADHVEKGTLPDAYGTTPASVLVFLRAALR